MSSSRSRSRDRRNSTEAQRLKNFNVTESSRMFGGSTNKPNPFDDDSSNEEGGEVGIGVFNKKSPLTHSQHISLLQRGKGKPNPFEDDSDSDDGMTDSLIKAGQDTAQSSPDRSPSSFEKDNSPSSLGNDNSPSSLGNASAGNSASGASLSP